MHRHHIVFRSHGGLTYPLNIRYMTLEEHEGNNGPHHNNKYDKELKLELQDRLTELFTEPGYRIEEIAKILGRSKKYFEKHFKWVPSAAGVYRPKDIIYFLMGGKNYFKEEEDE